MKNCIFTNPHAGFPMTTWVQRTAAVRLLRIFGVVDDVADGLSHRAAFAGGFRQDLCVKLFAGSG